MAVSLVATGVQFPDSTTQTTAAVADTYRSVTTTNTDITLTSADSGAYLTVTSTADVKLNLPAANAMTGSRTITIKNIGSFAMLVYDNAGNYLFPLVAGSGVICWASVNGSAAGTWTIKDFPQDYIGSPVTLDNTISAGSYTYNAIAPLTTTTQVGVYGSGNRLYGYIITNSSGVLTHSTPQELVAPGTAAGGNISTYCGIASLSSTTAVAYYTVTASTNYNGLYAVAMTISGSTFTVGTPVLVNNTSTGAIASTGDQAIPMIGGMSSTLGVLVWIQQTSETTISSRAFSVSGTTITLGTSVNPPLTNGSRNKSFGLTCPTTSSFVIGYCDTNGGVRLIGATVSGTTITYGTDSDELTGDSGQTQVSICHISTSAGFVVWKLSSGTQVRYFSISGNSASPQGSAQATGLNYDNFRIVATSSSSGVLSYLTTSGGTIKNIGFTVSGQSTTWGSSTTLSSGITTNTYQYKFGIVPFQAAGVTPNATFVNNYAQEVSTTYNQPVGVSGSTLTNTYTAYAAIKGPYTATINQNACDFMTALSSTRAIILVRRPGNDGAADLVAYLVDYSTTVPTYVSQLVIGATNGSSSHYVSIAAVSSTVAVAVYISVTGTTVGNVITVSGDSMSVGAQTTINSLTTSNANSLAALSSTALIVHYNDTSSQQVANVLTISGTVFTVGTKLVLSTFSASDTNVVALSATTAVCNRSSYDSSVFVLTISGTTITASPSQSIGIGGSDANRTTHMFPISSSSVLAVNSYTTNPRKIVATVLTISGGAVTSFSTFIKIPFTDNDYVWPVMMTANSGYIVVGNGNMIIPISIQNNIVVPGTPFASIVYSGAVPLGAVTIGAPNNAYKLACSHASVGGTRFQTNQIFTIGAAT